MRSPKCHFPNASKPGSWLCIIDEDRGSQRLRGQPEGPQLIGGRMASVPPNVRDSEGGRGQDSQCQQRWSLCSQAMLEVVSSGQPNSWASSPTPYSLPHPHLLLLGCHFQTSFNLTSKYKESLFLRPETETRVCIFVPHQPPLSSAIIKMPLFIAK